MLVLNPQKRITVSEALAHPYLSLFHDPSDEVSKHTRDSYVNKVNHIFFLIPFFKPICHSQFDFSYEHLDLTLDSYKSE